MAFIYPASIDKLGSTYGERKVHSLLSKLPDDCEARYEMVIGEKNRKPDFTIFSDKWGVALVEVKDWSTDWTTAMSNESFTVGDKYTPGSTKTYMNPELKCMLYLKDVKEHLSAYSFFRDDKNHVNIPVNYVIVLTNVTRSDFTCSGMKKYISITRVLFKEDLRDQRVFQSRLEAMFPPLEPKLTGMQMKLLKETLLPDLSMAAISNPFDKSSPGESSKEGELILDTYTLSPEQEAVAKSLGEGPRLLRGIAGTGKTMILLYRAKLLAANNPNYRILILCWNISLATYMQQTYSRISLPDAGNTEIYHFSRFIGKLLAQNRMYWYENIIDENISDIIAYINGLPLLQYDAIFIDEGQDFCKDWLEFLFSKLLKGKPQERNFLIAADNAQQLYSNRSFSWSDIGIPMIGRSKVLRTIYRNCRKVWLFAHLLAGDESLGIDNMEEEITDKLLFASEGNYDPVIIKTNSETEQIQKIVSIIKKLSSEGISPGNVLVLYNKNGKYGFPVGRLISDLAINEIGFSWIAEDKEAKRSFNWESPYVKISTTASAKGMDAPVVIVAGADNYGNNPAHFDEDLKLMYVALTRARELLVVLHTGNGALIPRLYDAHKKYSDLAEII